MKHKMNINFRHATFLIAVFFQGAIPATGQVPGVPVTERLAVTARPSRDSIVLRWAPLDFKVWQSGNTNGYRIERYTVSIKGRLAAQPEKFILHPAVKPQPPEHWEKLVEENKYAAIAAQALFGDSFETDLGQSNVFTIVNKVRENEQRFAFALFSADMSPATARFSGLWFTDKQVKKGEKYLYRVVINSTDSLRGSVFISPEDPYLLPNPQHFTGDFRERTVTLKWDKSTGNHYTAYSAERSEDGKQFTPLSETPMSTVSPDAESDTRYEYAFDSLKDLSKTYYYRVKGITPFGEESPPSDIVSGKGTFSVNQPPYIFSVENIENKSLLIKWDFPAVNNAAIKGFTLERSFTPKGIFSAVSPEILKAETRMFEDLIPGQVNYYRVSAHGLDGKLYPSQVYFAQRIDSLPPALPAELKASIEDTGMVTLSWKPNTEQDIYGYRVYKAYHRSEEPAQVTTTPIREALFRDTVDLNTLNESVYYRVMAVDINQNHSNLSGILKVVLPDKIKPQPPVFLPVESTPGGISLSWIPGSSEDIVQYTVYRKDPRHAAWEQLKTLEASSDSLFYYLDENAVAGETNYYTVVSLDDAGLESEPADPVSGTRIDRHLRPAITWKKPRLYREQHQITLGWNYHQELLHSFKIYKAVDHHPPVLFKTIGGDTNEFTDTMIPGQHYQYRILAVFEDGSKSFLSEEMEFQY